MFTTFAYILFGFGARMCVGVGMMTNVIIVITIIIGRRIDELELYISLVNVMKNFRLSFPEQSPMKTHFGEVGIEVERSLNLLFKDL